MKRNQFVVSIIILMMAGSCEQFGKSSGTFTDARDNHTYSWVKIGKQTWMAENLNYDPDSGCTAYENKSSNAGVYGLLYNERTACKACPEGWHLPTDEEWKKLENGLGMSAEDVDEMGWKRGIDVDAGLQLKSETGWDYNGNGTNESGFSALPAGFRNIDYEDFYGIGYETDFWSSDGYVRGLDYEHRGVSRAYGLHYHSVRCVKD